ncbi:MAG: ATP-binding protein [Patescibacteria group bacterium]|jgi:PAS domain S-box-containing protein
MWQENIILILIFLAGLSNFSLAAYVYRNGPGKRLNRNFSYLGFVIFLWCLSNFVSLISRNLAWIRLTYALGLLVVLFSFFLAGAIAEKEIKKSIKFFLFLISAILFIACFSPLFIYNINSYGVSGVDARFGPLFRWWEVYMIVIGAVGIYLPIKALPLLDDRRKKQIAYFYVGCFSFGIWSSFTSVILPFFGYTKLLNLDAPSTIFFTGLTSYAIIKYEIMGIKSLFFKAFAYSLIIGFISGVLAVVIFLVSWFFNNFGSTAAYLISIIVSIIIFLIGRSFYKETKELEMAKKSLTAMLQKSEEDRLKAEAEKNKTLTIIKNFSDGLLIINEEGKIIIVNPVAENYLGLKSNNILKKNITSLFENLPGLKAIASDLPITADKIVKKEIEINKNLIIEISAIKLNFKKKNIGNLIIMHDITRGKNVERLKTEFVTLAAHQLRTPLTAIKWSSRALLDGDAGHIVPEQREYIEKIDISTERMIYLIKDLLNVGRLEEGQYIYKASKFKIKDAFFNVLSNIKEKIDHKKIKLDYKLPADELPSISADQEKIEIVMQNFIENAINYSFEGGLILITIERSGEKWFFKVADSGIGISEESKGRIFKKFYRSEEAFKKNTEGSGLGLFMCKNIIENHGGEIGFESAMGKGSTFYFSLPLKSAIKEKPTN